MQMRHFVLSTNLINMGGKCREDQKTADTAYS